MPTCLSICSVLAVGSLVGMALVGFRQADITLQPLPAYDIRDAIPVQSQLGSQIKRLRARSDPSLRAGGDPLPLARTYLRKTLTQSGISDAVMQNLHLVGRDSSKRSGMTHLHFQQSYAGIEVFQCGVNVHFDAKGRVLSLSGSVADDLSVSIEPSISLREATRIAADHLEVSVRASATPGTLVVFPVSGGATHLGWRMTLHKGIGEWYAVVVDAHSGAILYRVNLYKFAGSIGETSGLVFDPHPDSGPQVLKGFEGDEQASPEGWVRGELTRGNNVVAREDVGGDDEIFPGRFARAVDGRFEFPFSDSYAQATPRIHDSNDFDLDQKTIRLTPRGEGYVVADVPFAFARSLGNQLDLSNDDSLEVVFEDGFTFTMFGTTYRSLFVNSNGNLTFGFGDSDSIESVPKFSAQFPRIAPLWSGFDVETSGDVFFRQNERKAVVTWNQVSQADALELNTFQVTLQANGGIEFTYDGVATPSGLVGISPGGVFGTSSSEVDFTEDLPLGFAVPEPVVEQFPTEDGRVAGYFASLRDQQAAITNLFYWTNFMHDYLYDLGFTEESGNFQENNFGRDGRNGDPLLADAQDGLFVNNAAIGVPIDGQSPRMAMGLFLDPPRDTAVDSDVIIHEYAHGLTERLVGGPFIDGCLNGIQSGGLGEGWSDFYAMMVTGQSVVGEYTTSDMDRGIRRFDYADSPLRFGDLGNLPGRFGRPISGGIGSIYVPQVHDDGEIWATVLWELRGRLGKERTELLVTEALKLTPCGPTMLDARDAILLADEGMNDGSNRTALWEVFASRGFGHSASAAYAIAESDSDNITAVFQAFDVPSSSAPDVVDSGRVLFQEDFERGIRRRGWTIEGEDGIGGSALWHRSAQGAAGGMRAMYYGLEDEETYDTGARNFGALTSPEIDLVGFDNAVLEFDHILDAEHVLPFDPAVVRVSTDDGETFEQIAFLFNNTFGTRFQQAKLNLNDYADQKIRIQFYFDTLDDQTNGFPGWRIDNVVVKATQ